MKFLKYRNIRGHNFHKVEDAFKEAGIQFDLSGSIRSYRLKHLQIKYVKYFLADQIVKAFYSSEEEISEMLRKLGRLDENEPL